MSIFKLAKSTALTALILAAGLWLSPVQGAEEPWKPTGKETPESMRARTTAMSRPKAVGSYYKATVPDTLDLAEHARLGINHLTSIISEKENCEMYWRGDFGKADMWAWPGHLWFQVSPLAACQPKAMEALAMERLMSGSQQNLELEAKMLQEMASHLGEDGIFYIPPTDGKKPWLGPEKDRPYANTHGQGRMMRAMIAWYQYSGNPRWKELVDRMADGLDRHFVVHKEDYAYVPTHGWMPEEYLRSNYLKDRGWKDTAEPENEKGGEEGSLFNHQGHLAGALAHWYLLTGNERALRLSGELVRFLTKPKFWADWKGGDYPGVIGAEHAHWTGHFHGHINTLRAILEYAIAANDPRLMQFVRDGYEWTRQAGLARIGLAGDGQGCGLGRLIGLAIKLTDAGIGDYWEDVDLYIRNHGTEMQFTPEDIPYAEGLLKKNPPDLAPPPEIVSAFMLQSRYPKGLPPGMEPDRPVGSRAGFLQACLGTFPFNPGQDGWSLCCSTHGNMGLFYAWDGALRYTNGSVQVNLLLNRASTWMDVDSWLPYEGKVILRNKEAKEAWVRIPLWVNRTGVQCRVGGRAANPEWFGNYVRFKGLKPNDEVTIEFPMEERIEHWTLPPNSLPQITGGVSFAIRFRGNTVLEIQPPLLPGTSLYQTRLEKYGAAQAPMKRTIRYVTSQRLVW